MRRVLPTVPFRRPRAEGLQDPETRWEWEGDADASVLVAGHSHRNAYRAAIADGLTPAGMRVAVLVPSGSVDRSAPPQPDESYWRAACATPGRVLAVTWLGNQPNRRFLFEHHAEPLRLHDSGEPGTVVPASMIAAFYETSLEGIEAAVASAKAEHVVILGTPPPKADEAIRESLEREAFFAEILAKAGESAETVRLAPLAFRVGLWKVLQDELAARAARVGAIFIPAPATAQTADGCLKTEYSDADVTHANGRFASLMLGEIEAALAQAEAARR